MSSNTLIDRFFRQGIHHKPEILKGFRMLYFFITALLILFAYWTFESLNRSVIYSVGTLAGQIAVTLFCLTLVPGILRRFGIHGMIVSFIMSIRRDLGVSMFALAFLHYASIRLWPVLFGGVPLVVPPPIFELFGVATLYSLAPIYLTSNNWSVKKLGPWWRRIHSMVYFIVWILFAHVALQEVGVWAILLGVVAFLEAGSLFYAAGKGSS